ncbi:MAG: hypothetical protein EA376_07915 [Phycisphaeraceae bacterium]|nr:MAG: hypothetical protein EA376_07915 [Phycisphaeraceae bacterium]
MASSLDSHTRRIEADIFDVATWRDMAQMFQMCPDPDEAIRAWALIAPASLIDERAGAALARFFTSSMPITGRALGKPYHSIALDAADELRSFIAESGDKVTILHWRAFAWMLVLTDQTDEAPHALEMMRTLAMDASSDVPFRMRTDVLRSMSLAWKLLGDEEKSIAGWRLLAGMMHSANWEAPDLNITWRALGGQFKDLNRPDLQLATYPHAIEFALDWREQSRGDPEWWRIREQILNLADRVDPDSLATDATDPLGRPQLLAACDRIESQLPDLGPRDAGLATLIGLVRRALGDAEGARRALNIGAEMHERRIEHRPDSAQLHYQLACARSLAGRVEEAIDAFERAIELGWSDATRSRNDPALVALRDELRFVRLHERIETSRPGSQVLEHPVRLR